MRPASNVSDLAAHPDVSLSKDNLRNQLYDAFTSHDSKVLQFPNLADAFIKKIAIHPFLIAPSSTFRTFNKHEIAKDAKSPTGSVLSWRLLSVKDVVDNVINSMPPATIIDPLLLDDLQEPEFYQWLKSLRMNPDRVQRMPSAELLRTLQQYRAHATRQNSQTLKTMKANGKGGLSTAKGANIVPQLKKMHNLDQLREKLRAKLETLQAGRSKDQADGDSDNKQVQKEISKLRREEEKVVNKKRKLEQAAVSPPKDSNAKRKFIRKDDGNTAEQVRTGPESRQTFSKLKRSDAADNDSSRAGKKRSNLTGRNFKRLLSAVNARDQKIASVAEVDADKAQNLKQKQAWNDALAKADGVKVRNDPTTINKAINKQTRQKLAKGKKWEARLQGVKDRQEKQQGKRQRNLDIRQGARDKKKFTRSVKRGHILPGFSNM